MIGATLLVSEPYARSMESDSALKKVDERVPVGYPFVLD